MMSLHKAMENKVRATKKLNTHCYNKQLNKYFSYPAQVQNVLHLLLRMHQDNIQVCAKHSVRTVVQFWQLLFVFDHSSYSRLQALVEHKPHLSKSPTG
jgi:hypothetical protein